MSWENWYLRFIIVIPLAAADLCPEPIIQNGEVQGEKQENTFVGEITCNIGYRLVGASKIIKCRHGQWNQEVMPVCSDFDTEILSCPKLPDLKNGRSIPMQSSNYVAYHFKCHHGFKLFGESRTQCIDGRWSHQEMPSCTKPICDETGMLDIPYGEGRVMMGGAVYKYKCSPGVEMTGSSTVVCAGDTWNGTVPHCNVKPEEPKLSVSVSGQNRELLRSGDWVLVSCESQGGYPAPDIGLTMDGVPAGSKDFRNIKNSFTFTATEDDDGKRIACTAVNKVGSSVASYLLKLYTSPKKAKISGPSFIQHDAEFTYECSIEGGNPQPKISWILQNDLGKMKRMNGTKLGARHSRLVLKTGTKERGWKIVCIGENEQGMASKTVHVNILYLPKLVQTTGPTDVIAGDFAHLTCQTTKSFPVPELRWRVEMLGDSYEVNTIEGVVSTVASNDGGFIASAQADILVKEGFEIMIVTCSAGFRNVGDTNSDPLQVIVKTNTDNLATTAVNVENKESSLLINLQKSINDNADNFVANSVEYMDQTESNSTINKAGPQDKQQMKENKMKQNFDSEENEKGRTLWIPYNPKDQLEDNQNQFQQIFNEKENQDIQNEFLRSVKIEEGIILKEVKGIETVERRPMSLLINYSSSSHRTFQSLMSCSIVAFFVFAIKATNSLLNEL